MTVSGENLMYKVFGMAVESLFLSGNICCDLSMSLDKLVLVKENIILLLPALSFESVVFTPNLVLEIILF